MQDPRLQTTPKSTEDLSGTIISRKVYHQEYAIDFNTPVLAGKYPLVITFTHSGSSVAGSPNAWNDLKTGNHSFANVNDKISQI
jgi:hypothetical protein